MNINWKLRFVNRTTLTAIVLAAIAILYQLFEVIGILSPVPQSEIIEIVGLVVNLFVLLGVITDPTTSGIKDSTQALTYDKPKG